jgi:hypothetical protein
VSPVLTLHYLIAFGYFTRPALAVGPAVGIEHQQTNPEAALGGFW